MRERWILETKRGDFNGLGEKLGVSPLVVRCMINRGLGSEEEMRKYLYGTTADLYEPYRMKDMDRAVRLVKEERERGSRVAIASDFDCDGIFSGFILRKGLTRIGFDCRIFVPDRIQEGYGLNDRIVGEAAEDGREFLITCDNGIAANEEIDHAREKGMRVIVTDHHEVQKLPAADVILDPKREGETYPFDGLCGAGVAFKLICALYDEFGIPESEKEDMLEYVAIATVADIMELRDENRILVKYGLEALMSTKNTGLRALLDVVGLEGKTVTAGHISFVLGPCFNAAGRIATVQEAFSLLTEEDPEKALLQAQRLKDINEERKQMTEEGEQMAYSLMEKRLEEKGELPSVLVLLLTDIHESLAGIIAGKVKERYNHPAIVFTRKEDGTVRGSGRSIEAYHMFHALMECRDLMTHFGGHRMAAGMTMPEKNLEELDRRLNENAGLTEMDFQPVIRIDAPMPIGYATEKLLAELDKMEPFGAGNPKPVFAEQHFRVLQGWRLGQAKDVLKLRVQNERGSRIHAMCFRRADEFDEFVIREWGEKELARMYEGKENWIDIGLTYYPSVNEFRGNKEMQIVIKGWCRIEAGR